MQLYFSLRNIFEVGPTFKVTGFASTTYGNWCESHIHIHTHKQHVFTILYGRIYYDGVYYQDWSVFENDQYNEEITQKHLIEYDPKKAKEPPWICYTFSTLKFILKIICEDIVEWFKYNILDR